MEQSFSESDISLSPSQLLERLQLLRQLQILQRGKLQKQHLDYQDSPGTSSSITEIVSHFSNSTTYNTFRSLLQSSNDHTPQPRNVSLKVSSSDLIDGVSMLNLSGDEETSQSSPHLPQGKPSYNTNSHNTSTTGASNRSIEHKDTKAEQAKKQIELDEMPILSPKKDFESLLLEKLQKDKQENNNDNIKSNNIEIKHKRPFLKRGEGMSRFGLKKNDLVIQATNALPWKKKCNENEVNRTETQKSLVTSKECVVLPKIVINNNDLNLKRHIVSNCKGDAIVPNKLTENTSPANCESTQSTCNNNINTQNNLKEKDKSHPLIGKKGKTWASILTKEQDDFLRQLKQSDYYKNFTSPAKSEVSNASSCVSSSLHHEKESAEQNMFNLLESKVAQDNFNLENSFFTRFLMRSNLECSGESTPIVMQKCLANNPKLLQIFPEPNEKSRHYETRTDADTCCSNYTDCDHDTCSSSSTCCSCKTVEETPCKYDSNQEMKRNIGKKTIERKNPQPVENNNDKCDTNNDTMKANLVEMNAKLVATSDLLKDRLKELEEEIETFRKENANLAKVREEIDLERQKFYEEKASFEQKFNEEKILSEYYLAEEKEKLSKQKQTYERYVREMRGKLNKKDKDEVVALKNEIGSLKDEIRIKDAKSTSTIARLRNQLKIMDKEKKDLHDEVDKLKKENKRLQHSNDITRRLTNIKYLEEINKKLGKMNNKEDQPEVTMDRNQKYKTFEIERQSRKRTVQPITKTVRPRAKSVPNINVTSRYAKYFSQKDSMSNIDRNMNVYVEHDGRDSMLSNNDDCDIEHQEINAYDSLKSDSVESIRDDETDNEENNLEKLYMETFKNKTDSNQNVNAYFLSKSNSNSSLKNSSKSPQSLAGTDSISRAKSPVSILSSKSSSRGYKQPSGTYNLPQSTLSHSVSPIPNTGSRSSKSPLEDRDNGSNKIDSSNSKTSLTRTQLNPTEIKKPDGSRELRFPNGNVKHLSADGKYAKFMYYNGDVKETFLSNGIIKYFYAETKTYHTTHPDGLEVLQFADGQVEKRYKDGSTEIRLANGSVRYHDPKNPHVREEWRFPDGSRMTLSATGEKRVEFANGQVEVHAKDHKRREFPDGTVKLQYADGSTETRYASGRVRLKDKDGRLLMDSAAR